eukprot:6958024-Pyramimonas_sp.AAC.1
MPRIIVAQCTWPLWVLLRRLPTFELLLLYLVSLAKTDTPRNISTKTYELRAERPSVPTDWGSAGIGFLLGHNRLTRWQKFLRKR